MPRKKIGGFFSSHFCAAFQTQELGDFVPRRSTGDVKNLQKSSGAGFLNHQQYDLSIRYITKK